MGGRDDATQSVGPAYDKGGAEAELDGQAGIQELAGDATMLYYMTDEAQEGGRAFLEKLNRSGGSKSMWNKAV